MDLGLKDRVALIAAASRGIGYAAAFELAREGARVFLCSRDQERASAAAQKIHEETGAQVAASFGVSASAESNALSSAAMVSSVSSPMFEMRKVVPLIFP